MIYDKKPNLVAISIFMQQYAVHYFAQKGYNISVQFVHNGIDIEKYPFDSSIKKTENLLFVGRYSQFKHPDWAIEVAKKTSHEIDLIGGSFVDNLNYLRQIESICDSVNTGEGKIRMYKDSTHEFKIDKMQRAKCLIAPSRMNEPFNLTIVESMSCGTPVIATNDGAQSELIIQGKTGYICKDINEMIDALSKIHTISPQDCRNRAIELSRENMAKNYEKLYNDISAGNEW